MRRGGFKEQLCSPSTLLSPDRDQSLVSGGIIFRPVHGGGSFEHIRTCTKSSHCKIPNGLSP